MNFKIMITKKNNNGSPVGKPTGCDNSEQILIVGGNRSGKSWPTFNIVMDMAVNENWTAPYSPPTESLPKRQRVKTVYRVSKNGTSKWREVIND
jgi:hypothetical protein